MVYCSVPKCTEVIGKTKYSNDIKLCRFPADTNLANSWLDIVQRVWNSPFSFKPQNYLIALCSTHFEGLSIGLITLEISTLCQLTKVLKLSSKYFVHHESDQCSFFIIVDTTPFTLFDHSEMSFGLWSDYLMLCFYMY